MFRYQEFSEICPLQFKVNNFWISKRYNVLLGSVEIHSKIVTSTKKSVKYWNYQESREIFKLTELSEVFELSYIAVIQ